MSRTFVIVQVVNKIEHDSKGDSVTVYTENGLTYKAKAVILTVSIGVLQSKLIEYVPDLPVSTYFNSNLLVRSGCWVASLMHFFGGPIKLLNLRQLCAEIQACATQFSYHSCMIALCVQYWKLSVIFQFDMAIYTKIFLKFPSTFWPTTPGSEYFLYADEKRGYYPVWQVGDLHTFAGPTILFIVEF